MTVEANMEQAGAWAAALWRQAVGRWSERTGQDRNYREHVVHPALDAILRERFHGKGYRMLEIGCGDGAFLDSPAGDALIESGGDYLGIDLSGELIDRARTLHQGPHAGFMQLDISSPAASEQVRETGNHDCLLSVFAVQEMPGLPGMLANLRALASPGTSIVIVTVHPDFGKWLLDAGHMRRAPFAGDDRADAAGALQDGAVSWRWAGEYPIVDEPREPFPLPYFHRTIADYRTLLGAAGFRVDAVRELPGPGELPALVERGISPFCEFDTNVYWPRMAEGPSSIVIIAHSEERP